MEEKYCERCGLYLGIVRPTRRYCSECKRKDDQERRREHEKSGVIFKPKNAFCAYCGKPMLKKSSIPEVPRWMRKESLQRKGESEC